MRGVVLHQGLGAVAVVYVPVHDQHPFASRPLGVAGGDDRVRHEAEAHGPGGSA